MPNLRRGFFRLWVLVAVTWVGVAGYINFDALSMQTPPLTQMQRLHLGLHRADAAGAVDHVKVLADEIRRRSSAQLTDTQIRAAGAATERQARAAAVNAAAKAAVIVLVPPLAMLVVGAALGWAFSGFRKR